MFTCSHETKKQLEEYADREGRTVSNLIERIATEWLKQQQPPTQPQEPTTIADLVRLNLSRLRRSGVKNLKAIASGEVLPTAADFAKIAATLGLSEEEQKAVWDKTFGSPAPASKKKKETTNGCT